MAGAGGKWKSVLAIAAVLLGATRVSVAQSGQGEPAGALSGKLTDLYSHPLSGVTVILRNEATGAEASTTTTNNGAYRFTGLEQGQYSLEARSPQLGRGRLDEIVVSGGHEARVQTAMEFEQTPASLVLAAELRVEPVKAEAQLKTQPPAPDPAAIAAKIAALAARKISEGPTPTLDTLLVAEPLKTFDLSGRDNHGSSKPVPAPLHATPPSAEAISVPAGQTLARLGPLKPAPAAGGAAVANKALASEQAAAMQALALRAMQVAAMQALQATLKPVLAVSQERGPAATATMSASELQALPVSGRHWQDFVLDNAPTSATLAGGQAEISLRAAGQQRAGTAVDGAGRSLAFGSTNSSGQGSQGVGPLGQGAGEPAGMAQVGAGGHGLALSETAIRAIETAIGNMEASAARAAGGRMNVETQRGGDKLHGQGFFFDRQNNWGAKNPFSQWIKEIAPASVSLNSVPLFTSQSYTSASNPSYTPPDHEIAWGIGAGSRIRRNKLFWFAALDGNRRNGPGLSTVKHPCLGYDGAGACTSGVFANPTGDQMQVLAALL